MNHNFKKLGIWRKSMDLAVKVYELTKFLPETEKYSLVSQVNRCSVSIPSNIAEGTGRSTDKDMKRFIGIALGSSYELETQLILIKSLYNNLDNKADSIIEDVNEVQKMIVGFIKAIK